MTDHIPNHKLDRSREIEDRVKLDALKDRVRASTPVDAGHDILRTHLGDLSL